MDQGGLLGLADRLPIGELPAAFRMPMRCYLGRGDLADGALRRVLEGDVGAALAMVDAAALMAVCRLSTWVLTHLPAYAHGGRDQVQLFIVYVRRARGRALLAAMEGADAGAGIQGLSSGRR